jgi:hypothetical protein
MEDVVPTMRKHPRASIGVVALCLFLAGAVIVSFALLYDADRRYVARLRQQRNAESQHAAVELPIEYAGDAAFKRPFPPGSVVQR